MAWLQKLETYKKVNYVFVFICLSSVINGSYVDSVCVMLGYFRLAGKMGSEVYILIKQLDKKNTFYAKTPSLMLLWSVSSFTDTLYDIACNMLSSNIFSSYHYRVLYIE